MIPPSLKFTGRIDLISAATFFENPKKIAVHSLPMGVVVHNPSQRSLRIDQARCLIGTQVKKFCTKNNITLVPATANDHRAIGLVERLISTIKQRLACIKEANKELNSFTINAALKSIIYQLHICKHKTTKLSPFESHFGRKANTPLSNISTKPNSSDLSYDKSLNHYLDEETVTPNELLPEEHWGNTRSDDEIERNMCKATHNASSRERLATDNESRFLRTTKVSRPIPLKEHAVQINIARKKHAHKHSKKNLNRLFEILAPGSVVQEADQYTSEIRETGKLEVTVRNSDIAKFGTRDERKTKLMDYVNRRGPRIHEKATEAKIFSHIKESTHVQKGDRKMKHRKREMGSGVSLYRSNIARAMRVCMPKVPENFAPPETSSQPEAAPEPQIITSEVLIAPLPTSQHSELTLPSTSAPAEALQQIPPLVTKRTRKSPKNYGYDKDNSSGESTYSCPPHFLQPRRKRRAGDVESVQPSIVQTIVDTASRMEPIDNPFPSPIIGQVSPTDPRIQPADRSSSSERLLDMEDL